MLPNIQMLGKLALVPVVQIEQAKNAFDLGKALLSGGLPCAEITFRTEAAEEAIHTIAEKLPEIMVGAGTVLTTSQAAKAIGAGAKFIVSPGTNLKVIDWCLEHEVPIIPGVATPTEIEMALEREVYILKFFPAEAMGGIETLTAIAAPYRNVKFIPTGGINAQNLADYLRLPMVFACGGSWFVKANLIAAGDYAEITRLTKEAVSIACMCRETKGKL